jgi:hypothetical protein
MPRNARCANFTPYNLVGVSIGDSPTSPAAALAPAATAEAAAAALTTMLLRTSALPELTMHTSVTTKPVVCKHKFTSSSVYQYQ